MSDSTDYFQLSGIQRHRLKISRQIQSSIRVSHHQYPWWSQLNTNKQNDHRIPRIYSTINLKSWRRKTIRTRKLTEWNYICLAFQLYLLCPFLEDSTIHIRLLKALISPIVNRHVYSYFRQCFLIYLIKNILGIYGYHLFFPPHFLPWKIIKAHHSSCHLGAIKSLLSYKARRMSVEHIPSLSLQL